MANSMANVVNVFWLRLLENNPYMKIKSLLLIIIVFTFLKCSNSWVKQDYSGIIINQKDSLSVSMIDSIKSIQQIHPNLTNLSSEKLDSLFNNLYNNNEGKLLSVSELIQELRTVTDTFTYNDPHFMIVPRLQLKNGYDIDKIRVLPFEIINVNDTILISKTYNNSLKKGDRILEINNIDIDNFLKKMYFNRRHFPAYLLQAQNDFIFSPKYYLKIVRANKQSFISVNGLALEKYGLGESFVSDKLFKKERVGYFRINQFQNNKFIVSSFRKHIDKVKALGYKDVIIDIRNNSGGSGAMFDELLSIFSDKDSLSIMKSQKLKVSDVSVNDYSIFNDSLGRLVDIPDSLIYNRLPLDSEKYMGKLNYYVLIDKTTASTASSFANILQFNNLALLVGEPLNYNATKYGDIVIKRIFGMNTTISTMEYNEYTKSTNGIVKPDIYIPYTASNIMKGEDSMLDELLEYILKNSK